MKRKYKNKAVVTPPANKDATPDAITPIFFDDAAKVQKDPEIQEYVKDGTQSAQAEEEEQIRKILEGAPNV